MKAFASILFLAVSASAAVTTHPLRLDDLDVRDADISIVTYRGRRAVRVVEKHTANSNGESIVILRGSRFHDGTIEADVAGIPGSTALQTARGFVGIAFRVQGSGERFECFYLRPTNGRADDQLRRNHSTQYISFPDFPWERLRKENPGVYESYVDLVPGEWTHVRIMVHGTKAELYVNRSVQPVLIVNDLKLGDSEGAIALWIGSGTEAHFANVTSTKN